MVSDRAMHAETADAGAGRGPSALSEAGSLAERTARYLAGQIAARGYAPHRDRTFMELELSSMDLLSLNDQIEKDFGIDLIPTVFFDHRSIDRLAAHLAECFTPQFEAALSRSGAAAPASAAPAAAPAARSSEAPGGAVRGGGGTGGGAGGGQRERAEDIAVIGMAGMFARSPDLGAFWRNLASGQSLIEEVPEERWDYRRWYDPARAQPNTVDCKWGSFIEEFDEFDAPFFNVSPREAERMDPQLRLLLQVTYGAAEDAGRARAFRGSRTGVFVGNCYHDYDNEMARRNEPTGPHDATGIAPCMLSNRVSFYFDLRGPSLTIDTACSSSLVALHLAMRSLRQGESELALVAGANLILSPRHYLLFSSMRALSATGRCHSFDASADGYVPGEAVAAVVLKPLRRALQDGDPIHAVLKGSAVNHGGHTNSVTAPDPGMQAEVLVEAWRDSGIDPETLTYIEAHGTGTQLGDPIEVEGLKRAFKRYTTRERFCALGSAKAHLGHTEAAAGLTGAIKTILAMKRGLILSMPSFRALNPFIKLDGSPLQIHREAVAWATPPGVPRRAGVSSFGFGGANAHVVLEEPPEDRRGPGRTVLLVFPLSARSEERLRALAERFVALLRQGEPASLAEIAYTLQTGREDMPVRLAVLADTKEALIRGLEDYLARRADARRLVSGEVGGSSPHSGASEAPTRGEGAAELARAWVRGALDAWPAPAVDDAPRRISLPTYPFRKERFWLEEEGPLDAAPAAAAAVPPAPAAAAAEAAPEAPTPEQGAAVLSFFKPVWTRAPLPPAASPSGLGGPIVLFDVDDRNRQALQALYARSGAARSIVLVRPGVAFRGSGGSYELDPRSPADYKRLFEVLSAEGVRPRDVLFLWGAPHRFSEPEALLARLDEVLEATTFAPFHLTQALLDDARASVDRIRLLYVYAARPTSSPEVVAHHEMVAGFIRAAASADPRIAWRLMGAEEPQTDPDALMARALAELGADEAPPQVEVLYREGERWTRGLAELPAPEVQGAGGPFFKEGGVYLITGGLGGAGFLIAQHLAARYRPNLVLTGRSPLDERAKARLARLEALGAEAVYLQSDVTRSEAADGCVAYALARLSKLDGVIHAAGVVHERPLAEKGRDEIAEALAPKVRGTLALDRATSGERLDFFIVLSSISTLLGTSIAADYASANRFMDSYVALREELRKRGLRHGQTLAINYPYWREGGMRMTEDLERRIVQATGMRPMPTPEALEALEGALALSVRHGVSQVVTAYGEVAKIRRALRIPGEPAAPAPAEVIEAPLRPSGAPDAEVVERLCAELTGLVASILKLKIAVEPTADLAQLGFESITILEFTNALNARYGVSLSPALFYEHRAAQDYARLLIRKHPEKFLRVSPSAAPAAPAVPAASAAAAPAPLHRTAERPAEVEEAAPAAAADDIAVIGMAGVFPGSPDLEAFWQNIEGERDCVSEIPGSRFRREDFGGAPLSSPCGGFIDGVERFDPMFFDISPLEAELMDPQQRVFLQVAWHALEDAGYAPAALSQQQVGVFVGVSHVDYSDVVKATARATEAYVTTSLSLSMIPNRLSYLLDLRGPSEPVDTGCSSALVALHRAISALRLGDCKVAIVGGVNLLLSPHPFLACSQSGMLSPDGRCMTFDKRANGYVRGEGVGVVVLKPLSRALADGDHIHAVIKGSGVNHGGHSQGLTVPNPKAQAELLISVYERAKVDPGTLGYIEAHGSATALGDPVEINGLRKFFEHFGREDAGGCGIGTVKTNIGHLESAAGIAGLIKVILGLEHAKLPANLNFTELNPYIDLEGTPLFIVRRTQRWEPRPDAAGRLQPRRAGVSSFGFGGVNAHVIVEEHRAAPALEEAGAHAGAGQEIVVLSAKSEERLAEHARRLAAHLRAKLTGPPRLADIAFTLQVGRQHFEHRVAILASSVEELIEKLEEHAGGRRAVAAWSGRCLPSSHALRVLGDSPEGAALIESLRRRGALSDLARLWVEGVAISWASFPLTRGRRRVPLPGYPFAQVRCWVEADVQTAPPALAGASLRSAARPEEGALSLLGAVAEQTQEYLAGQPYDPAEIAEGFRLLDHLGHVMLLRALRSMGILSQAGRRHDIEALKRDLAIEPIYQGLFHAALEILEAAGLVQIAGGHVAATEAANAPEFSDPAAEEQLRRRLDEEHPSLTSNQKVLTIAVSALPEIITGQTDYLAVLFPEGDMSLLEPLYGGSTISDYYSRLVAEAVRSFVEQRLREAPHARVNILEFGAGTGGTSAFVLEALKGYEEHVTYWYTDISIKFTQYGEEHVKHMLPNMRFKMLDLEKDPRSQGFEPGSFDLAFAANVVHATSDILVSLGRIHDLLRPGGILLLNELTRLVDFITLIFGLIKGWWLFQDPELRMRNSPLLSVDQWRAALSRSGFGGVLRIGVPDADENSMTQSLILSERREQIDAARAAVIEAPRPAAPPSAAPIKAALPLPADLQGGLREFLKQVFSETLKIPVSLLDPESTFAPFGVDSLISVDIVKRLERYFGRLQRSLLFEYITLSELAGYFAEEHRDKSLAVLDALRPAPAEAPQGAPRVSRGATLAGGNVPEVKANGARAPGLTAHGEPAPAAAIPVTADRQAPKATPVAPARRIEPGGSRAVATSAQVDIAIIGMGGVFPSSKSPQELWRHLKAGRDLVREVPPERFDWRRHFSDQPLTPQKMITRWGSFIDDVDKFDPQFFGISPLEAELMDPQQRVFLEVAWKTIEDAGYRASDLKKSNTGVFAGTASNDYLEILLGAGRQYDAYTPTGLAHAVLANRVSFLLDLRGPSEAVDTACSSALVAVHRAAQAIRSGECDMALTGGVQLLLTPQLFIAFSQGGFMAPDGRCRTFDKSASGFVRGEGAGAVLLKRLDRAIADGDHIYAVLKGSGVNHGGEVQSLTVPNPSAQADLIASVYTRAGIDPETVTFIEAHGTGTPLGDPIEINALKKAFARVNQALGRAETRKHYCGIGAIKGNIGHLESAAGIAGLVKVLLAMQHRQLPGIVHLKEKSPDIEIENSPFYLLDKLRPWEPLKDAQGRPLPRRAGVSSFGFGGANAHVVLEEYVAPARPASATEELVVLSARSQDRLIECARELSAYLRDEEASAGVSLADLAYTLQVGREPMPVRVAILAHRKEELLRRCEAFLAGTPAVEGVWTNAGSGQAEAPLAGGVGGGEDKAAIEALAANRKLERLAELWVRGVEPSWRRLHPSGERRRVPLPTYPFARERYWAEPDGQAADEGARAPVARAEPQSSDAQRWREVLLHLKQRQISVGEAARLIRI